MSKCQKTTSPYFDSGKQIKLEPADPVLPALLRKRIRTAKTDDVTVKTTDDDGDLPPSKQGRTRASRPHVDIKYESVALTNNPDKRQSREPKHWREVYGLIQAMRAVSLAPVDTEGCHMLADPAASPQVKRYHILTALMLSAQTKDAVTAAAMRSLQQHGLTIENVRRTPVATIDALICKVGFHTRKAGFIKATADILHDQYNNDIPDTLEGLVELPGVGPKMAHLTMQVAWDHNSGIGVDVHVHRIANRLSWVKTKNPEETRKALQEWLPGELWQPVNPLLVGFGQTICRPVGPKCAECTAAVFCPTAPRALKMKLKQERKQELKQEENGCV
eukprot:TRINITY_DN11560_c0_g1_i1.p1 TRINITY_DN11560_c0_g1~~TRINITY_DN11560_c0_g1_i1.p1  ORF type:complete len:333 (-),score=46.49 TRINITY_DN11560_c0_g1_i1:98-1096(-)